MSPVCSQPSRIVSAVTPCRGQSCPQIGISTEFGSSFGCLQVFYKEKRYKLCAILGAFRTLWYMQKLFGGVLSHFENIVELSMLFFMLFPEILQIWEIFWIWERRGPWKVLSVEYYSIVGYSIVNLWVKSLQGQSILGWLTIPLLSIQDTGPKNYQEVRERGLTRFSACFACVSWCLELLSANMKEPTESMQLYMQEISFFLKYILHIWQCIGFNVVPHIISCIYSLVLSFIPQTWHSPQPQDTNAKKNLVSPLHHFLEFLRTRVLDTH